MFKNLYRYSRVLARHLDGPAAEERDRFVAHFAASGAANESVLHLARELLVVQEDLVFVAKSLNWSAPGRI